jgi:FkbM family methyltransferase
VPSGRETLCRERYREESCRTLPCPLASSVSFIARVTARGITRWTASTAVRPTSRAAKAGPSTLGGISEFSALRHHTDRPVVARYADMSIEDGRSRDASPRDLCAEEHPRLMALLAEVVTAGDVFVDVGANTGYFAIPLAKLVGSTGRVLAFEPATDAAEQLRLQARAENVLARLTIYELALGNENGSRALRADPKHPSDQTKRSLFMPHGIAVAEVPVRSFDGLVDAGDIDLSNGMHAIKIDVEGAEVNVLSGMRRSLERHRPRMIVVETIETHLRRAGSSVSDVRSFMGDIGYAEMTDEEMAKPLELNAVFVPA